MLAHLHTLQSDNRHMQSRIMELASQREFYIAINTKLRQTLTEHELGAFVCWANLEPLNWGHPSNQDTFLAVPSRMAGL